MLSVYGLAAMLAVAGLLLAFGVLTRNGHGPEPLDPVGEDWSSGVADQAEAWLRARDQIGRGDKWPTDDL